MLTVAAGHPPAGAITAGCHDTFYWASAAPQELTFISRRLAPQPRRVSHAAARDDQQ